MSMSESFVPIMSDRDEAPAASDPGPGAPGTDAPADLEQPATEAEQTGVPAATQNPPFRTPDPDAAPADAADLGERD
ncbi:hypothetical protein ITJ64_17245 [Herbiconiux sp. VKM Ac-1786]|uniref:hypothetical protein n=1 Tax=Herbiconiux sp. VKM Ac-1786 TaxID=2783824 RepID=UPI00188A8731|nr:hypothetical protein [Herbiconiux sp. VKM Ac-1786]MBF4574259.1 hypothetical protein [Herbiconiux sp. VKM Ac-1786]